MIYSKEVLRLRKNWVRIMGLVLALLMAVTALMPLFMGV